jgi:hypothetical protein
MLHCFISATLFCAAAYSGTPAANEHVACRATLSALSFRSGDTGEIRVILTPASGIHVNGSPAPHVRLAPGSVAAATGGTEAGVAANGYLDSGSTIVQRFAIRRNAPAGTHVLRGTLTYYYCSDAEGWCMRRSQELELSLTITR